jgi:hypothetical protein
MSKKSVRFELISHDMHGIKIFERTPTGNRLVNISFAPKGIVCSHCETDDCKHVEYVLEHPDFQKTLEQKRKQGWNIP